MTKSLTRTVAEWEALADWLEWKRSPLTSPAAETIRSSLRHSPEASGDHMLQIGALTQARYDEMISGEEQMQGSDE